LGVATPIEAARSESNAYWFVLAAFAGAGATGAASLAWQRRPGQGKKGSRRGR
jgi:hypothetical protein